MTKTEKHRLHVFLVITRADMGGAQMHVQNLIESLSNEIRFTLGCGDRGYLTERVEAMGVEVIIMEDLQRAISPIRDMKCYQNLKHILKQLKPDLVHLHSSKAGIVGRLAAIRTQVPSLFTAHGWAFTEGVNWKQRCYGLIVEWLMARFCSGIISVSQYDFDLAGRFGVRSNKGNWAVLNGVKGLSRLVEDKISTEKIIHLLNIGRLDEQKNQKFLLRAAAKIDRNFMLTVVGSGTLRQSLARLAEELGIQQKVRFVENTEVIEPWFQQADIFVLSSNYEGLPLAVLEALSIGLPIVSTDVGGVPEAVEDGVNGFLVTREAERAFANNVTKLIDSEPLRAQFGKAGRKKFIESFQLQKMGQNTLQIYESVLDDRECCDN